MLIDDDLLWKLRVTNFTNALNFADIFVKFIYLKLPDRLKFIEFVLLLLLYNKMQLINILLLNIFFASLLIFLKFPMVKEGKKNKESLIERKKL